MKKCILLPLHLYDYEVQGNLGIKDKIAMYRYSIEQTLKASHGIKVFVICHGEKQKIFNNLPANCEIHWSQYKKNLINLGCLNKIQDKE